MSIERSIRNLAKEVVPDKIKPYLWLYYTDIKRVVETGSFSGFASVQVEINTNCNRTCSYCSNFIRPKTQRLIKRPLFNKIVNELGEMDYKGRFCPQLSSEPTMHPELVELMTYAREKMPKAKIILYTNGDFLNTRYYNQLKNAGVSQFIITQHGGAIPQELKTLLNSLSLKDQKITTFQTLNGIRLFNRGIRGLVPEERRVRLNPCYVAQNDLVILVDGSITLCGNDVYGENIFGNVKDNKIIDIWKSLQYKTARNQVRKGKFTRDICKRCAL